MAEAFVKDLLHPPPVLWEEGAVEETATGTSRSAVSRRFTALSSAALRETMNAPLGDIDPVALMLDGVGFGERLCRQDGASLGGCGMAEPDFDGGVAGRIRNRGA